MKTEKQTFAKILQQFQYKIDLRTAFDDFLTMTICAFGQNAVTGKSYDEDLYLETIARYKDDSLRFEFPKLLACLTEEMTERMDSDTGWDVLGEYYEQNLYRKGLSQFFTPWPICKFMAQCACDTAKENIERTEPLRIIDPSCGSGRTLLAASRIAGPSEHYFGIDIDHTCVKMTALNLFLSGCFQAEVMCGNALLPDDFKVSYTTRLIPFGLFRVQDKLKLSLWHSMQYTFAKKAEKDAPPPPEFNGLKQEGGSQLTIF